MTNDPDELADIIEMHLNADITPGYVLSEEDQRLIVAALRIYAIARMVAEKDDAR